jgi:catechol 2,3-dioxygenase-like lactoylglutathione lyase family enzyme
MFQPPLGGEGPGLLEHESRHPLVHPVLTDGKEPLETVHDSREEASAMSTPEFKLTFDAVYYHVTDMEKSIAFYRDILGLRLASRDYVARFDLGGVLFELVPNPPGNALPGTGNARLSLGVTDIRQATRVLQARGVATTPVKEEPGGLLSYFKDPDGNELCLWQYV